MKTDIQAERELYTSALCSSCGNATLAATMLGVKTKQVEEFIYDLAVAFKLLDRHLDGAPVAPT
jgi:hypothetical protein